MPHTAFHQRQKYLRYIHHLVLQILESLYHLFSSNNQTLVKQVNKMYEEKTALEVKYAQLEKEHMLSLCDQAYLFVEDCLPINQREVTNHLVMFIVQVVYL